MSAARSVGQIARLSGELRRLPSQTELDLSQNRLPACPPPAWPHLSPAGLPRLPPAGLASLAPAGLPRLLTLYLEENRPEELPAGCLRGLAALEELYLNHNRLVSIASSAFTGLARLLRLHLNANRLRAVDPGWFPPLPLPRLEILMLGENPIARLEAGGFRPLGWLQSLGLAGLGLRDLPAEAFQGLAELESLSLFRNRLARVPAPALRRLPQLRFRDLNENPIGELREGLQGSGSRGCPPAFPPRGWPERLEVAPGGSVTLSCPASAEPPPEISWLGPAGERLAGSGQAGGAVELVGVGPAHAGQYTCVARNEAGSA
ncbi:leucine-rich repeat neuronal protein 1-like [Chrysemys picta bellii]|uniref:leucine-rich repeat neuronal protein 1-like n=1 Tax=Chrysemys picta bellii TaxID=8478 RepID=UPI0032B1396A